MNALSALLRWTRAVRLVALLSIIVISVTACDESPMLHKLPPDAVILAFGDSLTFGTGALAGESYTDVLGTSISRQIVNAGIPGEVSADGLVRLPEVLEQSAPALVVLIHGGNDILRRLPKTQIAQNLRSMIGLIRAFGAQVVMLGVPRFGLFPDAAPFYATVAEQEQVPIDLETLSDILSDNDLKSDTVHPNAAGYSRMAAAVANLLRERGAL
ncbi:MAG: acyl-CoA thioesterase-1 [Gammaproteobacteria bacterium]|jgi:acyl-CoA thioesterase-1